MVATINRLSTGSMNSMDTAVELDLHVEHLEFDATVETPVDLKGGLECAKARLDRSPGLPSVPVSGGSHTLDGASQPQIRWGAVPRVIDERYLEDRVRYRTLKPTAGRGLILGLTSKVRPSNALCISEQIPHLVYRGSCGPEMRLKERST